MKVVTPEKTPPPITTREIQECSKPEYTDLDSLAGSWTPAEAADFDRELAERRKIDEELWK